jgi:uncharacterized protein (TIGR02466 family)
VEWNQVANQPEPQLQQLNFLRQQVAGHHQAGRVAQALEIVREMLAIAPREPQILGMAALMSHELGERAQAVKLLKSQRKAIDRLDVPPDAYLVHASAAQEIGEFRRASDAMAHAAGKWPDHGGIQLIWAEALKDQRLFEEAAGHAEEAVALDPGNGDAHAISGVIAHKLGHFAEAASAYTRALELGYEDDTMAHNLGAALVGAGRPDETIKICDEWLAREPGAVEGLALKGHALQEAGRDDEAAELFDFERFVKPYEVGPAGDFSDLDELNLALEDHVLNHPTLFMPPITDLKYHHPKLKISDDLLEGEKGPVAALELEMRRAVDAYLEDLRATGNGHPFASACPDDYMIYAWAAVLDKEGNQSQHIHKSGYLSGCYYLRVPAEVSAEENGRDGTIAGGFEVGRPPEEFGCSKDHMIRQYKPREGLMLLFPACFYHRTVPFKGSSKRICIAFDVIPV